MSNECLAFGELYSLISICKIDKLRSKSQENMSYVCLNENNLIYLLWRKKLTTKRVFLFLFNFAHLFLTSWSKKKEKKEKKYLKKRRLLCISIDKDCTDMPRFSAFFLYQLFELSNKIWFYFLEAFFSDNPW